MASRKNPCCLLLVAFSLAFAVPVISTEICRNGITPSMMRCMFPRKTRGEIFLHGRSTLSSCLSSMNSVAFLSLLRGGAEEDEESAHHLKDGETEEDSERNKKFEVQDDKAIAVDESLEYSSFSEDTSDYESEPVEEEYETESEANFDKEDSTSIRDTQETSKLQMYDDPIPPSPLRSFLIPLLVMLYTRKLDSNDAKVVKVARILFISYMVLMQIFLSYVRLRARWCNDQTRITMENPMANLLKNQLSSAVSGRAGGHEETVKTLASRFLTSQSTVVEYDIAQANQVRNGLLVPLVLNWMLHFKLGQVQPLFLEVARGIIGLIESPLFQVYILGRNLQRPFQMKNSFFDAQRSTGEEEQEASQNNVSDREGIPGHEDIGGKGINRETQSSRENEEGVKEDGNEEDDDDYDESEFDYDEGEYEDDDVDEVVSHDDAEENDNQDEVTDEDEDEFLHEG